METPESAQPGADGGEPAEAAPLSPSARAPGAPPATRPDPVAPSEHGAAAGPSPFRPAPGWYADPAGGDRSRWWDGEAWTNRTRPGRGGPPDPGLLHT